ncbi:abortive infection family protein [Enterococcus sp. LJL98]
MLILSKDLLEYYEDLSESTDYRTEENDKIAMKLKKLVLDYLGNDHSYLTEESKSLTGKFNSQYIEKQISLMVESIETHPADSIGKSKELLESCFKHILDNENIPYRSSVTLQELRNQVFLHLNLDTSKNVSAQSNQEVKKILSSLTQIIDGINNLRNEKGDGHGKGKDFVELPARYARLVVSSTIGIVKFVWETYENKSNMEIERVDLQKDFKLN